MTTTSGSSKEKIDWGITPKLTPEQIILWLEGHRELMAEIWRSNPGSREKWERLNHPETPIAKRKKK